MPTNPTVPLPRDVVERAKAAYRAEAERIVALATITPADWTLHGDPFGSCLEAALRSALAEQGDLVRSPVAADIRSGLIAIRECIAGLPAQNALLKIFASAFDHASAEAGWLEARAEIAAVHQPDKDAATSNGQGQEREDG